MKPYDYVVYQSERSRGSSVDSLSFIKNFGSTWDTLDNYYRVNPLDWQSEIFGKTGVTTTHNVTASGGSKKITYNFGYTYNDDKAIVINSKYIRHLLNLKVDYQIIKSLKIGVGGRYTHQDVYGAGVSDVKGSSYNRLRNAVKYKPFLTPGLDVEAQERLSACRKKRGTTTQFFLRRSERPSGTSFLKQLQAARPGGAGKTPITRACQILGTPGYLSPEQAEGHRPVLSAVRQRNDDSTGQFCGYPADGDTSGDYALQFVPFGGN